jgi:hypothetical protein
VNCVRPAFVRAPPWERMAGALVPSMGADCMAVFRNLARQFLALKRFGRDEEVRTPGALTTTATINSISATRVGGALGTLSFLDNARGLVIAPKLCVANC